MIANEQAQQSVALVSDVVVVKGSTTTSISSSSSSSETARKDNAAATHQLQQLMFLVAQKDPKGKSRKSSGKYRGMLQQWWNGMMRSSSRNNNHHGNINDAGGARVSAVAGCGAVPNRGGGVDGADGQRMDTVVPAQRQSLVHHVSDHAFCAARGRLFHAAPRANRSAVPRAIAFTNANAGMEGVDVLGLYQGTTIAFVVALLSIHFIAPSFLNN